MASVAIPASADRNRYEASLHLFRNLQPQRASRCSVQWKRERTFCALPFWSETGFLQTLWRFWHLVSSPCVAFSYPGQDTFVSPTARSLCDSVDTRELALVVARARLRWAFSVACLDARALHRPQGHENRCLFPRNTTFWGHR
jgi:hypothetical protein